MDSFQARQLYNQIATWSHDAKLRQKNQKNQESSYYSKKERDNGKQIFRFTTMISFFSPEK